MEQIQRSLIGLLFITCLGCLFIQKVPIKQGLTNTVEKKKCSPELLHNLAQSITVKVLSGEFWGSGIIIQKQKSEYSIVTNAHVLQKDETYSIQTPDGHIYKAKSLVNFDSNDLGDDLAILQFHSDSLYKVASLGNSSTLKQKEPVFASGFGWNKNQLLFKTGNISLVLDKPLKRGYQIGYLIDIEKGMSGGPLLNCKGEVVGINGKHNYPIWGYPFEYKDNSSLHQPEDLMIRSSWAIPIEIFVQQSYPYFFSTIPSNSSDIGQIVMTDE